MPRALFQKTGNAVYISHLDLMRLFQRAFKRAGLPLTHTQGFSPRPSVSIALPMSVGVESCCELLDFDLEGEAVSCEEIKERLNGALVEGVSVLEVYPECRKIRDIAFLDCTVTLEYDRGIEEAGLDALCALFKSPSVTVQKKGKNGITDQDIIPLIRKIKVEREDIHTVLINARVCCQNPALNPAQLVAAIESYLPDQKPDYSHIIRREIYDQNEMIFR